MPVATVVMAVRVVVFGTVWCGPCKQLKGELQAVTLPAGVTVEYVDAEREGRELALEHAVSVFPTTVALTDSGREIARLDGYRMSAYADWIAHLGATAGMADAELEKVFRAKPSEAWRGWLLLDRLRSESPERRDALLALIERSGPEVDASRAAYERLALRLRKTVVGELERYLRRYPSSFNAAYAIKTVDKEAGKRAYRAIAASAQSERLKAMALDLASDTPTVDIRAPDVADMLSERRPAELKPAVALERLLRMDAPKLESECQVSAETPVYVRADASRIVDAVALPPGRTGEAGRCLEARIKSTQLPPGSVPAWAVLSYGSSK